MGKGASLAIEVRPEGREPLFLALARAIIGEIERGRLRPGDPLPGTRALARSLSLSRNTVDAAYQDLVTQGWLAASPARGTSVARDLPDFGPTAPVRPRPAARPHPAPAPSPGLRFSDGAPDPRLAPAVPLGQAFRRALLSPGFASGESYGDPLGHPFLREALALYLRDERGLAAGADRLLITRGSQMALFLAAGAVADPGLAIAVESPGYPLAWSAFRAAGARILGVPVDDNGIDPDALDTLAAREKDLRAVYVTPHHQYPTTVTLGAGRRMRLLEVARRHRLTIIEDDYDHEYRFDGSPVLPLAARPEADAAVIHVGSLSKLIAPGIRAGYALAPTPLLRRMAERREAIDRQGDLPLEHALGELIADGTIRRHARKARRIYHARRDRLADLLCDRLADQVRFTLPAGGLAIWLRLPRGPDAVRWAANAADLGLAVLPGASFLPERGPSPPQAFRLGFAGLDDAELGQAVDLLARAMPAS